MANSANAEALVSAHGLRPNQVRLEMWKSHRAKKEYISACLPWMSFGVKHSSLVRLNGPECIAGLSLFTALDTDWCNYAILELFSPNELTGARIVFSLRYPSVDRKDLSTICHCISVYKHERELNVNCLKKMFLGSNRVSCTRRVVCI